MGIFRDANRLPTLLSDISVENAVHQDSSFVIYVQLSITNIETVNILLLVVLKYGVDLILEVSFV